MYRCVPLLALMVSFLLSDVHAQNLSFSLPVRLPKAVKTDKAANITSFKGGCFITWKHESGFGDIHVIYLGKNYDTTHTYHDIVLAQQVSAWAPVISVIDNHLYLLWISTDGSLKYVLNKDDSSFDVNKTNTVPFDPISPLTAGLTAATIGHTLLITSQAKDKSAMAFAVLQVGNGGLLTPFRSGKIPFGKGGGYPSVVTISDSVARFAWGGNKGQGIYYADYDVHSCGWSSKHAILPGVAGQPRAIYDLPQSNLLFYMFKGSGRDDNLYYARDEAGSGASQPVALPRYFASHLPVSVCGQDDHHSMMTFVGSDSQVYLSYLTPYNPATWMQDILMPSKSAYTLKDIVLPGAHDAGMSVLTAAAGMQAGTINECNTLTQVNDIAHQLNAGIRLFDLRAGLYNGALYAKHSSSDCIDSAIGGGYGERLSQIMGSIRLFLQSHKQEVVILTFSHFCCKELSLDALSDSVTSQLGRDIVYDHPAELHKATLAELAGKVIVTFDQYQRPDQSVHSCSISDGSAVFMNFRRAYAATNDISRLLAKEEEFFRSLDKGIAPNDIVRLDWQLTQSSDEAAMVCNSFQDEKTSPILSGAVLLTNVIEKHRSIIDLSRSGNKDLAVKVNEWIATGIINRKNKPNVLYVDVAGEWITDYCVGLNQMGLYR